MSEPTNTDRIQQLESRHIELIEELDALNGRLEEALNTITKPSQSADEPQEAAAGA